MGLGLAVCPLILPAQSVTVAWNPSATAGVTDYVLYYGQDGAFGNVVDAGTNTSITVAGLLPGVTNYFEVVAYDAYYDESGPSQQLKYFVPKQVVVTTNDQGLNISGVVQTVVTNAGNGFALLTDGSGTLLPNRSAQAYQTGKTYTLTATAAKGSVFANWVSNGVTVASTPKYTFTAEPNLVLQANFIPNPFVPVAGTYHGLFWVTNDVAEDNSGSFVATVTSKGAFTAKLSLAGHNYSYAGEFSVTGVALKSIPRPELSPITVQLELDLTTNGPMTGTVSDGNWTAILMADPSVYSKTNPAPEAGKYTLLLPGSTNASTQPGGNGFGAVTVEASGNVIFSGTLGDGTALTFTSVVTSDGVWPFYASLYGGKGSVMGWLSFTNGAINGQIGWFKLPQANAKFYPEGFTNNTEVIGSTYQYTNGLPVLGLTGGQLSLTSGNLAQSITNQVNIAANNEATDSTGDKVIFRTASGLFKGSMINPGTGRPISVSGIVLQNQNIGAGFFLGTTESGGVLLSSAQ